MSQGGVFEAFAQAVEQRSPGRADLLRRCSGDALVLQLVPDDPAWDVPHRLLAAVQWLVLAGEVQDYHTAADPWAAFRTVLAERSEFIARFVREQGVQTHVVQRCFALLPLFLMVSRQVRKPLDLLELGASGGLNLLWDRYGYRYETGTWGRAGVELLLTGVERAPVPAGLLRERVDVRRRRGIDLNPVDVGTEDGRRLLESFHDHDPVRVQQLRHAIDVARRDSHVPELVRGDYLELLPDLLNDRDDDALTVVFQTNSTVYLTQDQRAELREVVDDAGSQGPLAWISTPTPDEHRQGGGDYPLELAVWPPGDRRLVARMDVCGEWLEWLG